jgi:hypothetical protein
MMNLRLGVTKLSIRKLAKAGAVVALLGLSGCDQIPSEFHGKWNCERDGGTYEIGAKYIAYKRPRDGSGLSSGNWRGDVASVKDMGGGEKYVTLQNATIVGLKMAFNHIEIDGGRCTRTY